MSIRARQAPGPLRTPTPAMDTTRSTERHRLAFGSAIAALAISFAANAAPVPLYNIYRSQDGLTNEGVSLAVVA